MPKLKQRRAPVMVDYQREAIASLPGVPAVTALDRAEIAGRIFDAHFTVRDSDGRPAQLAVIDAEGRVIEPDVGREAWAVAVSTYAAMLLHEGHLTVTTADPEDAARIGERAG